jgi:phosphomannomutase
MVDSLKSQGYQKIEITDLDGLHFNFEDGWVLIRKSGTSPIIRVEAESNSTVEIAEKIRKIAEDVLGSIYTFGEMTE